MKKASIIIVTTFVVGTLIFLGIRFFSNKKNEIFVIDYNEYQELKNDKNNIYIVLFSLTDNKSTSTLEDELSKVLKNKKVKLYEIDINKTDKKHYSEFLEDINDAREKEQDTINIPTIIIFKNGRIVYIHEGFLESKELNTVLKENNIK